jgi:hypothetical protein
MIRNNSVHIKELDLNLIRPSVKNITNKEPSKGFKLTVIGKPGSGKSWLIRSILYAKRNLIPSGIVFSGTEDSMSFYSSFIPSTFIYDQLNTDKMKDFIKRQKIALQYIENPWSLLLLDDCTDDPKILNTPLFQKLYKNGRHWNMLYILSLQYGMDIRPVIRSNIDGVFILREPNYNNRKKLWENYASVIPDFSMFCDIMDQITNDYTALYIHNATSSNKLEDCIFWYKAPKDNLDFKFGSPDYWKFHNQRFNEQYQSEFNV